jgi:hypothetical protein
MKPYAVTTIPELYFHFSQYFRSSDALNATHPMLAFDRETNP